MKQVGEIISQLAHIEVGIKCRKCGAVPQLVGMQYSIRCVACGTLITVTPPFLASLKEQEYRLRNGRPLRLVPRCRICEDEGYVLLKRQVDDRLYDYGYRCICQAGRKRDEISGWPMLPEELAKIYQVQVQDWGEDRGRNVPVPTTANAEDRGTGSARLPLDSGRVGV